MATGWRWVVGGAVAAMLATWAGQAPAQSGPVKMEWLSWSIFRFTSPAGKIVVTNPFVTNPDSPVKVPDFPKVDVILVADGHPDEVGSTDEIAIATGAKIISPHEMWRGYFEPRKVPAGADAPEPARRLVQARRPDGAQRRPPCTGRGPWTSCTAGRPWGS